MTVDNCYWGFAHCRPRHSSAQMAPGDGLRSPTRFHRARNPAGATVGQSCRAAEPDENFLAQRCMVSRRMGSLRLMGVHQQSRSRLAVGVALVADQDSGQSFLRRGADAGLLGIATDRRPYNATFLPLGLYVCWKCFRCARCHL